MKTSDNRNVSKDMGKSSRVQIFPRLYATMVLVFGVIGGFGAVLLQQQQNDLDQSRLVKLEVVSADRQRILQRQFWMLTFLEDALLNESS
ncbi:MAG: hypothetical protein GY869_32705 [Planctomycetes bacterium]|nr:hypothetical protein [Planctomycetota bacterium]